MCRIVTTTCCFPHLPVVTKFLRSWPSQTDWKWLNWLKLTEADWKWQKIDRNRLKVDENQGGNNWNRQKKSAFRRFRMEGEAKKHLITIKEFNKFQQISCTCQNGRRVSGLRCFSCSGLRCFLVTKLRSGQSTVGGPKLTKIDLFRPKWTILVLRIPKSGSE